MAYRRTDFLPVFTSAELHRSSGQRDGKKLTKWERKEEFLSH